MIHNTIITLFWPNLGWRTAEKNVVLNISEAHAARSSVTPLHIRHNCGEKKYFVIVRYSKILLHYHITTYQAMVETWMVIGCTLWSLRHFIVKRTKPPQTPKRPNTMKGTLWFPPDALIMRPKSEKIKIAFVHVSNLRILVVSTWEGWGNQERDCPRSQALADAASRSICTEQLDCCQGEEAQVASWNRIEEWITEWWNDNQNR